MQLQLIGTEKGWTQMMVSFCFSPDSLGLVDCTQMDCQFVIDVQRVTLAETVERMSILNIYFFIIYDYTIRFRIKNDMHWDQAFQNLRSCIFLQC